VRTGGRFSYFAASPEDIESRATNDICHSYLRGWEGVVLELLYIGRFDYLAHPNAPESNVVPDDYAVAVALAAIDEAARETGAAR